MTDQSTTTTELSDDHPQCTFCTNDPRTPTQQRAFPAVYQVKTFTGHGHACTTCTDALQQHEPNNFMVVHSLLPDTSDEWPQCDDCKTNDSKFIRPALYRLTTPDNDTLYLCDGHCTSRDPHPEQLAWLLDQPTTQP